MGTKLAKPPADFMVHVEPAEDLSWVTVKLVPSEVNGEGVALVIEPDTMVSAKLCQPAASMGPFLPLMVTEALVNVMGLKSGNGKN